MLSKQITSETFRTAQIDALNEWWGLWLQMNNGPIVAGDDMAEPLAIGLQEVREKLKQGKSPTGNCYHLIKYANQVLDDDPAAATNLFNTAIEMSSGWAFAAFYNRAYCKIKVAEDKGTDSTVLAQAISDLAEADQRLQMLIDQTLFVQSCLATASSIRPSEPKQQDEEMSVFEQQMENRTKIDSHSRGNIKKLTDQLDGFRKDNKEIQANAVGIFALVPDANYSVEHELLGLYSLGLTITFDVKEKPKFNWNALAIFFTGVAQCLAGAFICVVCCGSLTAMGLGFISEGISDMIDGIQGMIIGSFD